MLRAFAAPGLRGRLNGLLTLLRGRERAAGGSWSSVSSTIEDPVRAFVAGLILLLTCATLSGCNDVAANPPNTDAQAQFALRDDANMAGPTVTIASVAGGAAHL